MSRESSRCTRAEGGLPVPIAPLASSFSAAFGADVDRDELDSSFWPDTHAIAGSLCWRESRIKAKEVVVLLQCAQNERMTSSNCILSRDIANCAREKIYAHSCCAHAPIMGGEAVLGIDGEIPTCVAYTKQTKFSTRRQACHRTFFTATMDFETIW